MKNLDKFLYGTYQSDQNINASKIYLGISKTYQVSKKARLSSNESTYLLFPIFLLKNSFLFLE